jgi:hypothetical protein
VTLLGDLVLHIRCFAWYALRKHGGSGGDESGDRKRDDCCLHCSLLAHLNKWRPPRSDLKLTPFRKRAASRQGEGVPFHIYSIMTNRAAILGPASLPVPRVRALLALSFAGFDP